MRLQSEQFLDRERVFYPLLCRLLARHKRGAALTDDEIASKGGNVLTSYEVASISQLLDWGQVPRSHQLAFLRGCNIDLYDRNSMHRLTAYMKMKRNRFKYLRKSPQFETVFKPLLKKLHDRNQSNGQ